MNAAQRLAQIGKRTTRLADALLKPPVLAMARAPLGTSMQDPLTSFDRLLDTLLTGRQPLVADPSGADARVYAHGSDVDYAAAPRQSRSQLGYASPVRLPPPAPFAEHKQVSTGSVPPSAAVQRPDSWPSPTGIDRNYHVAAQMAGQSRSPAQPGAAPEFDFGAGATGGTDSEAAAALDLSQVGTTSPAAHVPQLASRPVSATDEPAQPLSTASGQSVQPPTVSRTRLTRGINSLDAILHADLARDAAAAPPIVTNPFKEEPAGAAPPYKNDHIVAIQTPVGLTTPASHTDRSVPGTGMAATDGEQWPNPISEPLGPLEELLDRIADQLEFDLLRTYGTTGR